jgi:HAD superfamily hydrolase (TIGR01662 family)
MNMEQAKDIKLVILDVDGVMTDGRIVIDDNGVESRNFDIKDGMGVVVLMMSGVEVAIITSKKSGAVRHRAEELKIKRFHEGIKKKTEPYEEMLKEMGITDAQVAYVGDEARRPADRGRRRRGGREETRHLCHQGARRLRRRARSGGDDPQGPGQVGQDFVENQLIELSKP